MDAGLGRANLVFWSPVFNLLFLLRLIISEKNFQNFRQEKLGFKNQ